MTADSSRSLVPKRRNSVISLNPASAAILRVVAPFNPLRTRIRPAAFCSLSKVTSFTEGAFGGRRDTLKTLTIKGLEAKHESLFRLNV
jgi:hypothetical protein